MRILQKKDRMENNTFVLHDDSVNTYGFRLLTAGANLDEFLRNPVMFYHHRDGDLPIGRWENVRVENGLIYADAIFDEEDEFALKIKGKVERGFIRMASIGTWAPEEVNYNDALKLPGQTGPTITKWTLREASIVNIGANHNALRMYDRETGELINLADVCNQFIKKENMTDYRTILGLADTATDADVEAAVKAMKQENEDLQTANATLQEENKQLKDNAAAEEAKRVAEQKTQAVALVDAAVRDGRLNASGKDAFLALFDADFEQAKATLDAIPRVKRVTEQIEQGEVELQDLAKKSWAELDREGHLLTLKSKSYDLYAQKFKEEFGVDPQ